MPKSKEVRYYQQFTTNREPLQGVAKPCIYCEAELYKGRFHGTRRYRNDNKVAITGHHSGRETDSVDPITFTPWAF